MSGITPDPNQLVALAISGSLSETQAAEILVQAFVQHNPPSSTYIVRFYPPYKTGSIDTEPMHQHSAILLRDYFVKVVGIKAFMIEVTTSERIAT